MPLGSNAARRYCHSTWPQRQHRASARAPITALFPALRVPGGPASYTPELTLELLTCTGELPAGKRALHIILAEYRRALHDLATGARASQQPAR